MVDDPAIEHDGVGRMPRLSGFAALYYRWRPRWDDQGLGRHDRRSRPRSSPQRLSLAQEAAIAALPRQTGWGPDRWAVLCGVPAATVHRVIRCQGLQRQRAARPVVLRSELRHGALHLAPA
jgi:hypothetical protein